MLAKIADRNCQQAAVITIMLLHWQKKKPFYFNPDHLLWGLFNDATALAFTEWKLLCRDLRVGAQF